MYEVLSGEVVVCPEGTMALRDNQRVPLEDHPKERISADKKGLNFG